MKKRVLALILGLALCVGMLCMAAFAEAGNAVVELGDDGTINVSNGAQGTYLVPVVDSKGNVIDFVIIEVGEDGTGQASTSAEGAAGVNHDIPGMGITITPDDPSDPPVDPSDPPVDPSDPPVDPSDPPVDPSDPPVDPSDPPVDPSDPPVKPSTSPNLPSNPGTSYPSNPSYTVNSGSGTADGGTWTTNKTTAKKGDTVTITVTPKDGYEGAPAVKDSKGNPVAVTNLGGGKWSFTMPDSKVTVSVDFTPVTPPAPINPFTDVRQGEYYYDAVLWAVSKGITTGTSETTFSPNQTCTRAQTVTFLWRAAGSPKPTSSNNPFTDVQSGAYYYDAVLWAVENGITNGTSATAFSPNSTVTRGQVVTFQFRAAKAQSAVGNNPFVDVDNGAYYANAVQWAVNNGITNGTSASTFSPNNGCTRGQIVTFLYRADSN